MNFPARALVLSLLLPMAWAAPLSAQTPAPETPPAPAPTDPANPDAAPTGSTVITSDELHSDQNTHVSIFTNNVVVTGTNFVMTCQEMTVYFTKDNKIDNIIATGDVVINQPDRVTHAGKAQYVHDEDKFILTDQPIIVDHGKTIKAPKITIWRTTQKMQTEGHSTVILPPDSTKSATTPSTPGGKPSTPSPAQ